MVLDKFKTLKIQDVIITSKNNKGIVISNPYYAIGHFNRKGFNELYTIDIIKYDIELNINEELAVAKTLYPGIANSLRIIPKVIIQLQTAKVILTNNGIKKYYYEKIRNHTT